MNIPPVSHGAAKQGNSPQNQSQAVDSFYTATQPRSRGAAWSIFAPALTIAGDEVYGNNSTLRQWLEHRQLGYVLAVACDQRLRWPDREQRRVDAIAEHLRALAWERVSAGSGSKGGRLYDWTLIPGGQHHDWSYGLLVRRSLEENPEHASYRIYAPTQKTDLQTLVLVAGQRWQIEQAFQAAKGECGLDHYEVRHWQGWYRHITLSYGKHGKVPPWKTPRSVSHFAHSFGDGKF